VIAHRSERGEISIGQSPRNTGVPLAGRIYAIRDD
jgi:hypothetical protein